MASAGAAAVPPDRNRLNDTTEPPDSKGGSLSKLMVAVISAVSAIVVAFITSYFQYQTQIAPTKTEMEKTQSQLGDTSQQLRQVQYNSAGTLQEGQKLCRVLQGRQWRDSVIVPKSWNVTLCHDYALRLGGTAY